MLEALGNLGDFIGGVGVIITVIYLAYQVRQSSESTKRASYQAVVSAISDWSRTVASDQTLTRIARIGASEPDQLTEDEFTQFELLVVSLVRNFENVHYQYVSGGVPEAAWGGWSHRILSYFAQPGIVSWWAKHKHSYSSEFIEFIDQNVPEFDERLFFLGRTE